MELPLLKSMLKLQYLAHEGNGIPPIEGLLPHNRNLRLAKRCEYDLLLQEGVVPDDARAEYLHMDRFKLNPLNACLLQAPVGLAERICSAEVLV